MIGIKAKATEEAKWQDMRAFLKWYAEANKHLAVEMWLKRDTAGFLDVLEAKGRKRATINRAFHTLRTFSRWLRMRPDNPLRDNPVHTSMERIQPQREPNKLAAPVMWSLLKAADNLVLTEAKNRNSRPVRFHRSNGRLRRAPLHAIPSQPTLDSPAMHRPKERLSADGTKGDIAQLAIGCACVSLAAPSGFLTSGHVDIHG